MEPLRSLAFGGITAVYAPVGSGLEFPAREFLVQNLTNTTLTFSLNGVDDQFQLPASGFWINDNCANQVGGDGFFLRVGNVLYVRSAGALPASGQVNLSVIFSQTI